jgi:type IV pilus assembly protein PilO
MALDLAAAFGSVPKRTWAILGVVVGVAVFALYYVSVYQPKMADIDRLTAEARKLAADVAEKKKIAAQLPQLEREVVVLDQQLKEVLVKLPEEKEIPNLLTQVTSLGQQAGLEFASFRPAGIQARDFYSEVPINLRVQGTYHTLGTFFDRLSKMPRIVTVGDFRISPLAVKKAEDRTITAEFGVTTYTYGGTAAKADTKGAPAKTKK